MKNYKWLLLFTLLSGVFSLFSQSPSNVSIEPKVVVKSKVQIKGQVIDSLTNESVPYVTVKIITGDSTNKVVKVFSTDTNGKFNVEMDCPKGDYRLVAQYVGKGTTTKSFSLNDSEKQLDLEKVYLKDNQELSEVVVTAIKPLVQVDLDKISYDLEQDPDSKTNNVLDMLRKVPMVTIDAEDVIQLKGSTNFKIYMDGKPSNMISRNPSEIFKSMPANTIKKIEVITDPGAKYDAEGVNGIINIVTNKQPMGGYNASVNAGVDQFGGFNGGAYLTAKYGKFGFTGNYGYYGYKRPESYRSEFRESFNDSNQKYLSTNEINKNRGNNQFGSGELSYEIDTLNLLSMSFNRFGGGGKGNSNSLAEMKNEAQALVYSYNQTGNGKYTFGGSDVNVDYQRTFRKKDELLTASYRLNMSPEESESQTNISPVFNYYPSSRRTMNDASTKEHTFQIDYTTPITKNQTIEAGAKYIIRLNESNSGHDTLNFNTNQWALVNTYNDRFLYRYDILSAYGGYSVKSKKIGFKAGLRVEETIQKAEYELDPSKNFTPEDYLSLVPSSTVSYQLKQSMTFRLGYNMRIQRPGIWYLNPYINNKDPRYISQGNPDLEVEKGHNLNLNYSMFSPKLTLNAGMNYSYMGNAIERVTTLVNDVSKTTYENIGRNQWLGTSCNINWNPSSKLNISSNLSGGHSDIKANDGSGTKNSGYSGNYNISARYTFPYDFVLGFYGGGSSPTINLYGKGGGYQYSSISISKSFLKKNLTLSLRGNNVFEEYRKFDNESMTDQFKSTTEYRYVARTFSFNVLYRFGEMKQQIKKSSRGIKNEDSKSGGGGGTEGSGGGN